MKRILFWKQGQQQAGKILFALENANKALGYLRNLIISWAIGFGGLSDLYFLVFGVVSAVSGIITGALNATFIPYSQNFALRQRRMLLGGTAIVCTLVYLLVSVPSVVVMVAGAASPQLQEVARSSTGWMVVAGVLAGFMALQLLQLADEFFRSRHNFILGGAMLLLVNFAAVVMLQLGLGQHPWLLGAAVALPALLLVGLVYGVFRLARPALGFARPFLVQASPLLLSGSVGMVNVFVDRWFASGFEPGRLSLMQTSLMLITQLGAAVISPLINAAYPFFSAAYLKGDRAGACHGVAGVELRIMIYLAAFIVGYGLAGREVLGLVYERGAVSAANVDEIFRAGGLYLPVLVYGSLVGLYLRVLYCHGQVRLPALISMAVIGLNILLNALLVKTFGWPVLAISASVCAWLYWGVLLVLVQRQGLYRPGLLRMGLMTLPILQLAVVAARMAA